jgi:hypothetical protein
MKRATRVSEFPTIRVAVNPRTLEALEAEAEERALPLSAIVREALDRAVRPTASLSVLKP